mgnify:CR=1 FL=1
MPWQETIQTRGDRRSHAAAVVANVPTDPTHQPDLLFQHLGKGTKRLVRAL